MFDIFRFLKRAARSERRSRQPRPNGGLRYHRRLGCEALEVRTLLSVALAPTAASAAQHETLSSLPLAAQQSISTAIGQDQAAYHATSAAAGLNLTNAANAFTAQLHSGALQVSAGSNTWDMSLVGLGFGGATKPVGTPQTSANSNRVDFNYGAIDEWYVNGPQGLEQGFTLPALTRSEATGTLTLQLALGGNLTGTVNAAENGLTLNAPGGSAALDYTGLTAYDAQGKALPATLSLETIGGRQELLIHVDDAGAQGAITIDPFVQQAKLTASDASTGSDFGYSVAVSGNTVVVGVPNANAAYIFTEGATGWSSMTQTAKLTPSDVGALNEFGYSVAISGNTVVVASPYATGSIAGRPGAAYIFTEPSTGWANMTQTAKLTPADGATGPAFGQSVAISGSTVVVGATGTATAGQNNTGLGAAYVFTEPGTAWANITQTGKLSASDGTASDNFGQSVAISGSTILVGAQEATIGTNAGQGAAYVFTEPGTTWASETQTAKLTASDGTAGSLFGSSVSISGSTALVGAWGANGSKGSAYEFTATGGVWSNMTQTAELTASDGVAGDNFGFAVAISGNTAVVGAPDAAISGASKEGAVYEFTEATTGWANMTQSGKLFASDGAAGALYGNSVSVSGLTVVAGADNAGSGQGAAYVSQSSLPYVSGITPTVGPLAGGTSVTISGSGFTGATAVKFGTTAATNVVVVSPIEITATSPAETAATVDVTVTGSGSTSATSSADQFTYMAAPTVTGVTAASGPLAGGATVTITGTGFTGATAVNFGTVAATNVVIVSATQLTATSPAEAAGQVDVKVTGPGGTSATGTADHYTYVAAPTVTGVSPTSGPLAGGTTVTITGSNLSGATAVDFGVTPGTNVIATSATQITAVSPAETAGFADVTVVTVGGTSATSLADEFTYVAPPTLTGLSVTGGPLTGGTSVVITGSNFTGATAVKFGSTAATTFTVNSATQITATSPAETAGAVTVTVTTVGGTASSPSQFTYTAAPTLSAITPTSGALGGGTKVTITGTNFSPATAVDFGTVAATSFTLNSLTQITAVSPAELAGTVNVTVVSPGGTSAISTADHFTYVAAPVVTSVTPAGGPVAGGAGVTINGTGFSGATAVDFGTLAATGLTVNAAGTQITATCPAQAAGTVDVTVTAPGGVSTTSTADQFTYYALPTVTALSDSAGPVAGGTPVTITGTNFSGATTVLFGTVAATNVVLISSTQISATSPGEGAGSVDVTVVELGGTSTTSSADLFHYVAAPTVSSLAPAGGSLAGNTTVTIDGTGFTGVTAVDFGTTPAESVTYDSAGQLTVTSPPGVGGVVNVTVYSSGGVSAISASDQFTYVASPTVTALSATAGPLAGGTSVTITGTGFLGQPIVDFGGTAATNVTLVSSTQITATSPPNAAGPVDVTVNDLGGTSATSAADQFTYLAVPDVTSVTPAVGPLAGGTTVSISGVGFTGGTTVKFGTLAATNVVVASSTELTATSPAESAGTVNVTVTTVGGTSGNSTADQFTYQAPPAVTGVSPASGPLAGGTSVTIAGTVFSSATAVDFGAIAATNVVVNAAGTQITATSPAEALGTVNVTVTGPGGVSAISTADQFSYVLPPTVTAVGTTVGPLAGGTSVTITGTGFATATGAYFGSLAATSFKVNSATQITVTSPAESAGPVNITVTGPGGASATSAADEFTYLAAPTVTGLSAVAGPLAGGTAVTITGTGFSGATVVDFGTLPATNVVVVSATQITAASPAEAAGTVDVTVTGLGGVSADSALDQFTYMVPPTVTGVSPTVGPTAGGASVVINGASFTGATVVDFGTLAASSFTVNSATQITAVLPAEAAGTVNVAVTGPGGSSTSSPADQFTFVPAPTVTGVSPATGYALGGNAVTITGTGFSGRPVVDFGTIPATNVVVVSATQITAISPVEPAGTVDITVTGPGGVSATSAADQFTALAAPTVTAVTPAAGPIAGGTSVTITGTGFSTATAVDFGAVAATNMVIVSATRITASSPVEGAGTVDVTVTGPGGPSATSAADHFTYLAVPSVTSVSPASGHAAGGTSVTITGTGFSGTTLVDFGTFAATSFTVVSATQITAVSPAVPAGTVDVTVTSPGGVSTTSAADRFTAIAAPTVTGVSPAAGSLAGGNSVTITGTGFSTATAVDFGTTPATSVVIVSATQLTAVSPAGTVGTVDVTVTGPGGSSATSAADQFVYVAVPAVTAVSPAAGPLAGGTSVTITGVGFTAATVVDFGTLAASSYTVNSDTQITATSPAESAGTVDVTVTGPSGVSTTSSADQFSYLGIPVVTGVNPVVTPLAGGTSVRILGQGFTGATAVDFGAVAATTFTVTSDSQIIATSPAEAAGTVNVTVVTPGGTSATSSADQFTYVAAPSVTGVSTTAAAGAYAQWSTIPIVVTFNEPVTVTGSPQLSLNAGGLATANYTGGSGTSTLSFLYTVQAGQSSSDLDYTSPTALALRGGTIDDAGGVAAILTLPAPGTDALAAKDIVISSGVDGFETGNFSALPWQLSSSGASPANWTVESSVVHSGTYAAESGAIGASSSSTLSVTLSGPAGEFSFWRMVSSAAGGGVLNFEIDGVSLNQWSGSVPWQQSFYGVTAGPHTYTWTYSTGSGAAAGANAAFLDDVAFTPGKTLTVVGTTGNDQFSFNDSSGTIVVGLNGETHSFAAGQFSNYVFQGGGGSDTVSLTGSSTGTNSAALYSNGSGQLTNSTAGYAVAVSGMASINVAGQAADTAQFFDALGNATFYAYADYNTSGEQFAEMVGSGYANSATGFGTNEAYSTSSVKDTAVFSDSPGDDTFYAYAPGNTSGGSGKPSAGMYGTYGNYTSGYANSATGFSTNVAYSTNGGSDTAYFYDSPGNDTYYAYADYNGTGKQAAGMYGSYGGGFANSASGFGTNVGYSSNGGSDAAYFYDAAGSNTFYADADYDGSGQQAAGMYGTGYANSATGFATNIATAIYGSGDTAYFEDAAGSNTFYAYANYLGGSQTLAGMNGSGYANLAKGFSTMIGTATYGTGDTADLYDSRGNDALYTDAAIAQLYGGNFSEQASGFAIVNAFATLGGVNTHTAGPDALSYQLRLDGTWVS